MKARDDAGREQEVAARFFDQLDHLTSEQRFQFLNRKMPAIHDLLLDHEHRGYPLRRMLESLPDYQQRLNFADKMRGYIRSQAELADVLVTLHPVQQEGYKLTQREYWKTLPCHHPHIEDRERTDKKLTAKKKRELSKHGMFNDATAIVERKLIKVEITSHYNLRPRRK